MLGKWKLAHRDGTYSNPFRTVSIVFILSITLMGLSLITPSYASSLATTALSAVSADAANGSLCSGSVCNTSTGASPLPTSVSTTVNTSGNYAHPGDQSNISAVHVWFFYASWCPHCHRVLDSGVLTRLPNYTTVSYYEVDVNRSASLLFSRVASEYHIPQGVPTVLVFSAHPTEGVILQGDESIINNINRVVKRVWKGENLNTTGLAVKSRHRNVLSDIIFLIGVAASDSINPCIMAVMLIMLATLAAMKEYKRMKFFGIVYILCVYLSYLAIGVLLILGSMYLVNQLNMFAAQIAVVTKWVVALILVIAGLINIKDFFFWGKGFTFNINEHHKQRVVELAKKASVFAIISIAAFVTVVEFPCSGIMYLGAIFYWVSQGVNPYQIFAYLLLYNVIFVLPLVIMLWIALMGRKAEEGDVSRARDILMKNKEKFRLIMGLALLGLAYLVLAG